jgi:hypothetical protein
MLTSQKVECSMPDDIGIFDGLNPSSCTMALGSTQSLTEMSTGNLPGGKEPPPHKTDNLAAICDAIV